jgi:hypothetical protein
VDAVRKQFLKQLDFVHSKRRQALMRAVEGLIRGGRLWLTGLGRDLPGKTLEKHRIKAVDRLLGNVGLQRQRILIYRALAHWLLQQVEHPIFLVDATEINARVAELRVAVCFQGRAVPVYSLTCAAHRAQRPTIYRRLLRDLSTVLPAGCRPTFVTDAGFHIPWFNEILKYEWNFVGRVRNTTLIFFDGAWVPNKRLLSQALRSRARDLGRLALGARSHSIYRFILAKELISKHRKRRTRRGTISRRTRDKRYTAAAREPWLLATSLDSSAPFIVATYARRMQVEESFRDSKSPRYGWSLSHTNSSPERVAVLLLVGAIAMVLVCLVGLASEMEQLHLRFQANTTRKRRILSVFFLGRRVLHAGISLSYGVLLEALVELRRAASQEFAHIPP